MTRVVQLIDSLDAGGAERLAVSYANLLSDELEASFLCTTRAEGILKKAIDPRVGYLFLKRKSTLDVKALLSFKKFLKANKINLIHAHATSFFFATLVKLIYPKIKLIWHDHYGKSEFLKDRPKVILKLCSVFFYQIFSVNQALLNWAKDHLYCKKITYLQNIVLISETEKVTQLKGLKGKRILCLANLRAQKDHINLFKSFKRVLKLHKDWTLHCVGKDFNDSYSLKIKEYVTLNNLEASIYFYGSCSDIKYIFSQCEIGVLSSKSEGLPIALLEYGLGRLAVVVTDVGDCNKVIDSNKLGLLVTPEDHVVLANAIEYYIGNKKERQIASRNLKYKVEETYSKTAVIQSLLEVYN